MKIAAVAIAVVYVIGFALTFWLHTQMPVTTGLAILRSYLWPVWVLTGRPHGQPMPMD